MATDIDEIQPDIRVEAAAGWIGGGSADAEDDQLKAWIAMIVARDQAAFAALYAATVGRLYHLAVRITGDAGAAEEAVEDAFWQVWRQAPRYDPARGNAWAWLVTIVRSRALDLRRKQGRQDDELDDAAIDLIDAAAWGHPDASLESAQTGRLLQAALAGLDPLPRQLLALAYYRGLTHEEIAEHTRLPLGTVKAHLRRTLMRLRDAINLTDYEY